MTTYNAIFTFNDKEGAFALLAKVESLGYEGFVQNSNGDEVGPNRRYQMYSRAGDDACEALVRGIVKLGEMGEINRLTLDAAVQKGIKEIAKTHPEVHDTEPDSQIPYEINKRLCEPMRWVEYGRWTD